MGTGHRWRHSQWVAVPILTGLVLISPAFVPMAAATHWTDWLGPNGSAKLRADLRDEAQNARNHVADVEVEVQNVWLSFPESIAPSGVQQGILRYRVDRCPPIVTVEPRIRFEQLSRGLHVITIGLLGTDNRLLTPQARLEVHIP